MLGTPKQTFDMNVRASVYQGCLSVYKKARIIAIIWLRSKEEANDVLVSKNQWAMSRLTTGNYLNTKFSSGKSLLLVPCLLSIPSVSLAAIQVFVFPSRPSSSNISSVLYSANQDGINQRSNSEDSLGKLLPEEFTFCSSHQQELLDGSPPYQVVSTSLSLHGVIKLFKVIVLYWCIFWYSIKWYY